MKLMHVADLHMDRAFEGLRDIPELFMEQLKKINQQVFAKIVDKAIENQVDLFLIAGDTFHQSQVSIQVQVYFLKQLERLNQANIPVILSFGNHDYYSSNRYWFPFPKNVRFFENETVTTFYLTTKAGEKLAISGFSYTQPWIEEGKLIEFPEKNPDYDIHIGVYHGDLNRKEAQNYAPFTLSEMKQKNYDYWALGHIHQTQVLSAQPLIVYPGTPQGHSKKETNLQGAALVTLSKGTAGTVRFEPVSELLWEEETYSLSDCHSLQEVFHYLIQPIVRTFEQKYILKEIILTDIDHLGDTFVLSYENGELLTYLREKILEQTQNRLLITSVKINTKELNKIQLPASNHLLKELLQTYDNEQVLKQVLEDLVQNGAATEVIAINQQWREQGIEAAAQLIQEDFIFQEDLS